MERSYDEILEVISTLKIGETYSATDNSNIVHGSWYACFSRRLKGENRNNTLDFLNNIILEVSKEIKHIQDPKYKKVISSLKGLCNMTQTYFDEKFRLRVQDTINEVNTIFNINGVFTQIKNEMPVTIPKDSLYEFNHDFNCGFEIGPNFEISEVFDDLYISIYKIVQEEKSFFFRYVHELYSCDKLESFKIDEFGKSCIFNYGINCDTIIDHIKDPFMNNKKLIINANRYDNIALVFCKVCTELCKKHFILKYNSEGNIEIRNNCDDKNVLNNFFSKRIIEAPPPLANNTNFINNIILMSHSLNEYCESAPFITEDENDIENLKSILGGFFHFYKNRGNFYYRIKHDINTCLYFFDKIYMIYMKKNSNIVIDTSFSILPKKSTDYLFYKMPSRISKTMYNQYVVSGFNKVFSYYIDELMNSDKSSIVINIDLKLSEEKQEDYCLPYSKVNINKYDFLREIFFITFNQTFTDINHKVILKNNEKLELIKQNSILK